MMAVDYSIEFAHIYVNQIPSKEQTRSIKLLAETITDLEKQDKTYCTVILIDDFTPERTILDVEEYIEQVKKDTILDFVAFESRLAAFSKKFIAELPKENTKSKKVNEIETKTFVKKGKSIGLITRDNKPSCSLLIAIWYLCRLGVYPKPEDLRMYGNKDFIGKKIITILDKKYKETEGNVLILIKATKYRHLLDKIGYKFF